MDPKKAEIVDPKRWLPDDQNRPDKLSQTGTHSHTYAKKSLTSKQKADNEEETKRWHDATSPREGSKKN